MRVPLVLPMGAALAAIALVGCQEEDITSVPGAPAVPEERLIENSHPPSDVDTDPTPQSGTGGEIPGYDPAGEAGGTADAPAQPDGGETDTTPEEIRSQD